MHCKPKFTLGGIVVVLLMASSVAGDDQYKFLYKFSSGSTIHEMEQSRQESGAILISRFEKTVEFIVTRTPASPTSTLTARITSLSNKGRRINYYDNVTFKATISDTGEINNYSFSGGRPEYHALIMAAGPANRSNIFWMPRFPDTAMKIGDTFTHTASFGNPGMSAGGRTVYELAEVEGDKARFRVRQEGSVASASVGGSSTSQGQAVFDMKKGMWESMNLNGEGTATMAGGLISTYTMSSQKTISQRP
ncbi:MAG: hypothetical protein HKM93_23525 [Desulfobacteraceae bacterium]|nr:hypothetical protein [Desulfobacteraceae bacterium]